ncbi:MAG TPA: GspH/FimT family protein [Gammaproteobacteria bacterium]|jgi:prepilin-type N-terminal cleavage/methylation domain-containing protein|nr:GspH/FimT family protein [Gammaproteobacteria bacterium]
MPAKAGIQKGFSLLELLITLIIIVIIAAFAIPNLKHFLYQSEVDALAPELIQAIQLARSESIINHQTTTLCGSDNFKTCSNHWDEGYMVLDTEKVHYTFRSTRYHGFLHWRAFPKGKNDVTFLADGSLNAENGTFWYCVAREKNPLFAIAVSQSARARVINPNAAGEIKMDSGELLQC